MNFTSLFGISAAFVAVWSTIRSCFAALFCTVRLRGEQVELLLEKLDKDKKYYLIEGGTFDDKVPDDTRLFCWLGGAVFWLSISERQNHAGMTPTGRMCTITFFRKQRGKIKALIQSSTRRIEDSIPVLICGVWGAEKLSEIKIAECANKPYLDPENYRALDTEMSSVFSGAKDRGGIILHGAPGCGKSYLIRHFAAKYKVAINIMTPLADWSNQSVYMAFSQIKGPAIVALEDFDAYFSGRECQLKDSKFTFDAFLNVFDGNVIRLKNVVFVMTTNYLHRIDDALKYRPSRFRLVQEIPTPDFLTRMRIIPNRLVAETTEGFSLDGMLWLRDLLQAKIPLDKALMRIPMELKMANSPSVAIEASNIALPGSKEWKMALRSKEKETLEQAIEYAGRAHDYLRFSYNSTFEQ